MSPDEGRVKSDFSADWLALREPADLEARSAPLTDAVARVLAGKNAISVLDVACGTGSNLRYLAERLPLPQDWLLVDHDPRLLAQTPASIRGWAATRGYLVRTEGDSMMLLGDRLECHVRTLQRDLVDLTDAGLFDGRSFVTASALLDLVSEGWLRGLAARCQQHRSVALFALNYDGRIVCRPTEPDDDLIRNLVNRHQRTDKGFGPALGPDAAATAERLLAGAGYRVQRQQSDWVLSPAAPTLQRALVEGWAQAAVEIAPERGASIRQWRDRRRSHIDRGESELTVGHQDVAAW
jgi:hypothetical protein